MNAKKFVVFDIDGTLIRWQLYHAVVDRMGRKGLLEKEAYEGIKAARMIWKRREHPESFGEYETELIRAYEQALPRIDPTIFDQLVDQVAEEYKPQVYTYTRGLLAKLKKKGYAILAISGSHEELVKHIAELYGFDDYVGTQYERTGGRFSGKSYIASHHKAEILQDLIKKHDLTLKDSFGVGDSQSDAAFLELVANPIAFNPDSKLYETARKNGWKIVVERKNVVYQLEAKDGRYQLA